MKRLVLAVAVLLPGAARAQPAPATPSTVLVETAAARQGGLPRTLVAYGVVQGAPGSSETLSLQRAGQVTQIRVAVGQRVSRGDPLLTLVADPSALAAYRQAVTALALARGERARLQQLLSQQLATRDQLAVADKAVQDAQSTLDVLNRGGGGEPDQTLTAPYDGFVAALPVTAGARVAAQTPLVALDRTGHQVAVVGIEPGRRGELAAGQAVRIEPLDGGDPVPGTMQAVAAMLDPATRLVPAQIDVGGTGPSSLLQGGAVRATIALGTYQGWVLPRSAVRTGTDGSAAFQVAGGKAVRVAVQVVGTVADQAVVSGPLDPMRPVVTAGAAQLDDGTAVRVAPHAGPPQ